MTDRKQMINNLFKEILASDKLNLGYLGWALTTQTFPDDPTWMWQQLKSVPWIAMAIYDDMEEKDGMVSSCLETRKDGVLSKPRVVLPASDKKQDKKVAEFIEETLHDYFDGNLLLENNPRMGFESFMFEALDAVAKGVCIGEKVFAEGRDRIYFKDIKFKPQHLFSFGDTAFASYSTASMMYPQTGPLRLRQGMFLEGVPENGLLPESKFFTLSYRSRYGNRWGSPLMRKTFWASWIKRAGVKNWLKYAEKGSGSVVTRYPGGASPSEQQTALEAAQAINDEPAVAIPERFAMEVMEMVRNIGSAHKELVDDFCNNEIARVILGQTLTSRGSEGGGSRALGEVHQEVRAEKIEADAKALIGAVNIQLIWSLVLWNFGPNVRPPMWTIQYDPQEDQTELASRLYKLWEMNTPIQKKFVFDSFQLPEPSDDPDEILTPKTSQPKQFNEEETQTDPAEFAEGKKKVSQNKSAQKSNLKTVRFRRLRPSMIQFSDK